MTLSQSAARVQLAAGLAALVAGAALAAQEARFELVHPTMFSAGTAFVNAWADYDNDGDLDMFVGFDGTPNRLYRNQGGGFEDAAAAAGIADPRPTRAAAWGDADADGDSDLLVGFTPATGKEPAGAGPGHPSVLRFYRNTKGVFRDDTEAVGLRVDTGAVRQPVWIDFDGDGDLDLFVAFRDKGNALFRNDGARFMDIAADVGLADARRTVGAVWFDFDEDGDLDLVTGNMDGDANGLFRQQDGKFVDVAEASGVAWGGRAPREPTNGTVRPCVADVNNDGRLDLFFANYGKNGLFLNRGKGVFEDVSAAWAIDIDARYDSCAFADMDNDGDLDLYVNGTVTGGKNYPDYLFRNAGARFEDVSPAEIGSPNGDHGAQWADFDLDGDMDLALTGVQKDGMHWLLRNLLPASRSAHALNMRVLDSAGRATLAGAEISVQLGVRGATTRRQTRLVDAGSGYNSQNDAPVHITMPDEENVVLIVTVKRPGRSDVASVARIDLARWRNRIYEFRVPSPETRLKPQGSPWP